MPRRRRKAMPVDGGRLGILGVVRIFVLDVAGVAVVATGTGIHGGNRHNASQSTFSSDLRIDGTAAAADANTSTGIMCRAETGTVEAPAKLVKGHLTLSFCLLGARIGTHTGTVHRGVLSEQPSHTSSMCQCWHRHTCLVPPRISCFNTRDRF